MVMRRSQRAAMRLVVRHQHQRGPQLAVELEHQRHDGLAGGEIQAAGGLVGQQHRRLHHEGPRQRHALLLAARQHLGVVAQPLPQADPLEHLGGLRAGVPGARQLQRQHDVLQRAQVAHELETLEHKTDLLGAQGRAVVFAEGEQVLPGQPDRALGGGVQACDDGQQGAFARARSADNGGGFARGEREVNIAQNGQSTGGVGDRLENVLHGNN